MSKNYVIRWKSKVNGRAGRGSKEFTREEAEELVKELNQEYPGIEHDAIPAPQPAASGEPAEPQPTKKQPEQPSANKPVHALP